MLGIFSQEPRRMNGTFHASSINGYREDLEMPYRRRTCVKSCWDYGERDGRLCLCPALQPQVSITQPLRTSFGSLPLVWIPSWMAGLQTFVSDGWLRLISCFVFCPSRMGFPSTFCNKTWTESIFFLFLHCNSLFCQRVIIANKILQLNVNC